MKKFFNSVIPKLPSKDLSATKTFYVHSLGFQQTGGDYPDYLMVTQDFIELHFFLNPDLNVFENYGMCYIRVSNIDELYQSWQEKGIKFVETLKTKPWHQKEFAIIDPDHNLLTFGQKA